MIKSSFAVPDRQLTTLRLQVPKEFQDNETWAAFCKQPGEHMAKALGSFHSFGAWQKLQAGEQHRREMVLECYAKVTAETKEASLSKSGADGIFAVSWPRTGQSHTLNGSRQTSCLGLPTCRQLSAKL